MLHMYVCTQREVRVCLHSSFLRQGLSWNLELSISARLAGQQASRSLLPLTQEIQVCAIVPRFYVNARD